MKKSAILLFLIPLSLTCDFAFGQKFYTRDLFDFYNEIGMPDASKHNEQTYDAIDGSPYLTEEFVKGSIQKDRTSYEGVPLRYNAFDDRMEFLSKSDLVLYVTNPEQYQKFILQDKTYIYRKAPGSKSEEQGFFQLLEEGTVNLLKKESISLLESQPAKPFSDPKPASFKARPASYYLSLSNGELIQISKEKDLLKALKSQKEALESYIDQHKMNVKREDDLQKVIAYANTL
ncbi:hypothetical protein [Sunxiuqinia rutila]|uniref:hypothetical protein n=1 Tax=Sunxiuqinia rutila TaxID=1397841 RepID=UPI003D35B290